MACATSALPLGGLAFGLTASAFRHAPIRGCPRRVGSSAQRVGLRAHGFRFSARTASEIALGGLAFGFTASVFRHAPLRRLPSAGWPSGSLLPLFGMRRFGNCPRRVGLRVHRFRFSARAASEWPSAGWFFRWAGWPSGSLLPLFGMRRSAPPYRRSEDRRSTTTRQLFHFKTLIPTC